MKLKHYELNIINLSLGLYLVELMNTDVPDLKKIIEEIKAKVEKEMIAPADDKSDFIEATKALVFEAHEKAIKNYSKNYRGES